MRMPKETVFSMELETALRDEFLAAAAAAHRPAPQLVREFMADFVAGQRDAGTHNAWFQAQVEAGLRQADDPNVKRIPQAEVEAKWRKERAELVRQAVKGGR
jgi:predicted transcriptional regulator